MKIQFKQPAKETLDEWIEMNDKTIKKINEYIFKHCICDGLGPLDGFSDSGNFEGLSKEDFRNILKIFEDSDETRRKI